MKSLIFTTILSLFTVFSLFAQLSDDFSGPDVDTQVDWQGDVTLFRISEGQLQLFHPNATGSSTTQLYTTARTSLDAFTTWRFWVNLDFSPSSSNFARIYLGASSSDLEASNAYYLQIGGISGSDDALVLYRQDSNGGRQALLSGQVGGVGTEPALARVQITRTTDGLWTLETDYTGGPNFQMEDAAMDATYAQLTYFGLYCQYTSTRSDRFRFDDIFVDPLFIDQTAPEIENITVLDLEHIQVSFSEPISSGSLQTDRFNISGGIGQPVSLDLVPDQDNVVRLSLGQTLQNLREYTLTINNLEDLRGNIATELTGRFSVLIPQTPQPGDILLSEVLFHPQSGGEDFVEIYNASDQVLDLNGLIIRNNLKLSGKTEDQIEEPLLILPGQYLAITDEISDIDARYPLPDTARLFENDLPTLDVDEGNVSLFFDQQLLQSFDYTEDLHNPLLDSERGVSLERLSFLLAANDPENWVSATAATGFATPGYANAQKALNRVAEGNIFELERQTFSPDGDSFEDLLLINYQTQSPGFLANIRVFDAQGRLINQLSRNESLASRGLITWDGTDQEDKRVRTGIYVIWIELFTPQGDKQIEKLTCILASRQ